MMRPFAAALLLFALAAPTQALVESEAPETYSHLEKELPGRVVAPVFPRAEGADRAFSLSDRLGGRWSLRENPRTGTAHLAWGSGVPMSAAAGATDAELERLARELVDDLPEFFGVSANELQLDVVRRQSGKSVVWFRQIAGGVPVEGARAHVLFHDSGRLMGLGSDARPGLNPRAASNLDRATAVALARADLPFVTASDEVVMSERVIVELDEGFGRENRMAWRVVISSETPPGRWNTLLDADTGEVLSRHNEICLANVTGNVAGDVHVTGYCDGDTPGTAFPHMFLDIDGGGSGYSDADGNFDLYHSGSSPVTVTGALRGPWLDVDFYLNSNPEGSVTTVLTPGVPGEVYWTDAEARNDEVDTFVHSNVIHDFMKTLDAGFTGLDYVMPCIIDRTDGYCPGNAWWDYYGINFCREGNGFANTGEIGNVIFHEYGHGITTHVYGGPSGAQPSSDLHEGNSDIAGLLMDGVSVVGYGFYLNNCASGIRNSNNNLQYPGDMGGSGHFNGQILAGVFWDAFDALRSTYGEEYARNAVGQAWHDGRMLSQPDNFPDQVYWTFVADDDDGNLDNGTPHHAAFAAGAEHHGFDYPEVIFGVYFVHTPLSDTDDEDNPYPVQAQITSTEAGIDPSTVVLRHRLQGELSWNEITMTDDGGDSYSAAIPPYPVGSQVDYYLYAEDATGLSGSEPDSAPTVPFTFFVSWLIDPLESDAGWTVDPDGTDGAHASGVWVNVDPVGSSAQPDGDHTGDGTHCWVTGQHVEGEPASNDDVDFGRTTLMSPVYDLTGAASASIRYWRWYSSDSSTDEFDLWLSNDGGGSWTRVTHDAGSTNGWINDLHNLADHFAAPGLLRLKFSAEDYGAVSTIEAAIDDISILATFEDLTGVDDGLAVEFATELEQNSPNPFNPVTEIRFGLAEPGPARLAVYDARGRLLRVLVDGHQEPGEQRVTWDGRDDAGKALASGVYLYRLETPERTVSKRMLLIK